MKWKLRTQLTLGFICIVLLTVAFIFMRTNRCIGRQYEAHLQQQQEEYADTIALGLSQQYSPLTSSWNVEFIHGYGMPAPMLPLTSIMTACTTAGRIASVTARLWVLRLR